MDYRLEYNFDDPMITRPNLFPNKKGYLEYLKNIGVKHAKK